ncbi:hypothetical protein [Microcystis aeruginosa]|uniref:hypothetical protein n=1 Tax=Microcystis aeruginosa TaxID=1126 RepID=UPI0002AC70FE|nr:hypothetical protein [Microcystis aeruginosa]ELS45359.1 hypothetical protein C789_4852 [Microcystis aeruginosa FACHB-905 = DIANCHI905]
MAIYANPFVVNLCCCFNISFRQRNQIFSIFRTLAGAQDEQKRAKAQQSQNKTLVKSEIIIYERQGWYATVVKGIDQDNKDKTLGYWREKFRPSSFLIDFNDWCKNPSEDKGGYFECE